jgi:hypothetical protein
MTLEVAGLNIWPGQVVAFEAACVKAQFFLYA